MKIVVSFLAGASAALAYRAWLDLMREEAERAAVVGQAIAGVLEGIREGYASRGTEADTVGGAGRGVEGVGGDA